MKHGPANFLFSSEAGKITAWSQDVPPLTTAADPCLGP